MNFPLSVCRVWLVAMAGLAFGPLVAPQASADSVVVFNELQYNPPGTTEDGEWIELYNQMGINVDLSGWRLDNGVEYTFPDRTTIPPGGYLIVAKDPANPALAGAEMVFGPYDGFLSNGGERVDLLSSADRRMDRLDYGDSGEWPVAADGSGATLSKRSKGLTSGKSANWVASPQTGGTPGAVNFGERGALIRHELVPENATWTFEDSGLAPAGNWREVEFNDTGWSEGEPRFGTDGGGGAPTLGVTENLVQRFRAADLAGATQGETLTNWPDTATGDGSAQSATAGGNPTFQAGATPSGQPAVRFDGNDEFRASLPPGIGANAGFVYIAVVGATEAQVDGGVSDGSGAYLWDRNLAATGNPLASLKFQNGKFAFQKRHDDGSGLGGPASVTSVSTTEFQIVAIRRKVSSGRFEIWVDGRLESAVLDNGRALTPQPIVIGRHATNVNGGFVGDIAELLVYEDELTTAEFQEVGSYLEARYGLETDYPGSTAKTGISPAAGTTYFRQEFTFNGNPTRTSLRLDSAVADGAVIYLNGSEIYRANLADGAVSHSTKALSDLVEPAASGFLPISSDSLRNGTNVLAVSLHTAAGSNSASFTATLEGTETPSDPSASTTLVFNEVAGAGDADFFVEIANLGGAAVDTTGYVLSIEGDTPANVPLPATTLQPGDLLQLSEAQLGQRPMDNDKLFLRTPSGTGVVDARAVTNRLRGRSAEFPGEWVFPNAATPGAANSFRFESDIVINEICYNAPIIPADPGVPPTVINEALLAANAVWRFNQSGEDLGTSWAESAHPVGGNWDAGPATLAFDPGFPHPIGTELADPASNSPRVITYYFETDFSLTPEQAAQLDSLKLTHLVDDGAVFYLNGVEILRFNMPDGEITADTLSRSPGVNLASFVGPVNVLVPAGTAVAGTNRLSVEVHQSSTTSGDVVLGLQASAAFVTDPGVPPMPRRPSDEQWIELYNRGPAVVNLSGWDFGEGIDFTFPQDTLLESGDFLVVARDPAALLAAHPGIAVIGPFSGSLDRGGETVVLRDAANNPADRVRYFDGGQWPARADGRGSTLELRDPHADNALPAAWAPSDELARTTWQTYRYRGAARASAVGPDNQWREFVMGMLEDGEVLLDDISVKEGSGAAAVQFIADGSFERGNLDRWRVLGNHRHATIVPDPDGGGNNVLHLRATGSTEHMHNHLETTLANGESVVNGRGYEISFKARWLSGCNLIHTRLYFNRMPMTIELERPEVIGTPGVVNSTAEPNIGPTSWGLSHEPAVPSPGEPVTVSVNISDPDGIDSLTLRYSVNDGSSVQVAMTGGGSGSVYQGTIPGQNAGAVVRFYVNATDAQGASSLIPAAGREGGAFYQVDDGRAADTGIHNFRIVMSPADTTWMHTPRNVMSNDRLPCTVIYNESDIYYNAAVRIKGSERARSQVPRVGFNIAFPDDNLFRGVHRTLAIDRSEGVATGVREILFDIMAIGSRGVPGEFNDLCYVLSPNPVHTSAAVLQLARFNSVFLDEQFENGADGTVFEYELIYYPTTADAEGYKLPQPDGVVGTPIRSLGPNKEDYRWNYLIKNNQEVDDYSGILRMTSLFDKSGAAFEQEVHEVLDVDQWLRAMAYSCAAGAGDSYFANSQHNGQFYARPDGRMLYFPHDIDFAFSATRDIFQNRELQELTVNQSRRRQYLGHLHDICTTSYNQRYMLNWTRHFDELIPGGAVLGDDLSYINSRSNFILSQVDSRLSPRDFTISTNGGSSFSTSSSPVTLAGRGWVNVRKIRLAGSESELPTTWTSLGDWEVAIPLSPGANQLTLEAVNFTGEVVGTDTITVTSSAASNLPSTDTLVISEIYYNPTGNDESTEYIELLNISPSVTLDLTGLSFTNGVAFTFPGGSQLGPGERVLLVSNQTAFEAAFGSGHPVAGTYSGNLDNDGERIEVTLADGTPVQSFRYNDRAPWPTAADGDGYSLVLVAPFGAPDHSLPGSWRASAAVGGSPGQRATVDYASWKAGFGNPDDFADPDGDQLRVIDEYFYGGSPTVPEVLGPIYDFAPDGLTMIASVPRRAEAEGVVVSLQTSPNLRDWSPATGVTLLSNERLPGSSPGIDLLRFEVPLSGPPQFFRVVFGP